MLQMIEEKAAVIDGHKVSVTLNFPTAQRQECFTRTLANNNVLNACSFVVTFESATNIPFTSNIEYYRLSLVMQRFFTSDGTTDSHSYLIPVQDHASHAMTLDANRTSFSAFGYDTFIPSEFKPATFHLLPGA